MERPSTANQEIARFFLSIATVGSAVIALAMHASYLAKGSWFVVSMVGFCTLLLHSMLMRLEDLHYDQQRAVPPTPEEA